MVAGAAGRDTGLASRILEASFRTETPKMFAALSLLVATGVLIFWLSNLLSRAVARALACRCRSSLRSPKPLPRARPLFLNSGEHRCDQSLLLIGLSLLGTAALANDKVTFATNWKAQAAHGGFYQAVADGTYKKFGLDVTIVQGGPQVNNRPLLPAGRIEFLMTGNLLHSFDNVKNQVPTVVVAAIFQKDPQALIAHPGQGYEKFDALKRAPVAMIAKDGQFSWWQWLKVTHGFKDEALKPYNYNLGPFLANPKAIQQAYSVAEPIYVENQGKFKPVVHLLADHGFSTYSTLIETRSELVRSKPDLVRRFVDASATGWANYLSGDRKAAAALMMKRQPRDDRGRNGSLGRTDEVARHCGVGRGPQKRHRRNEPGPRQRLLRTDGQSRPVQGRRGRPEQGGQL